MAKLSDPAARLTYLRSQWPATWRRNHENIYILRTQALKLRQTTKKCVSFDAWWFRFCARREKFAWIPQSRALESALRYPSETRLKLRASSNPAVSLPCSVQNFKTTWQLRQMLYSQTRLREIFSLRWVSDRYPILHSTPRLCNSLGTRYQYCITSQSQHGPPQVLVNKTWLTPGNSQ